MRLIDANTLKAEFTGNFNGGYYTVPEIHALINTAPTVGGWISVKDRVPEASCEVIVWAYGCALGEYLEDGLWWVNGLGQTRIVTHWMPLPEPPNKDKVYSQK